MYYQDHGMLGHAVSFHPEEIMEASSKHLGALLGCLIMASSLLLWMQRDRAKKIQKEHAFLKNLCFWVKLNKILNPTD